MRYPDKNGHFGQFGGRYVSETLMPALYELEEAYQRYRRDPEFVAEFEYYLREYVGRPNPLYYAEKLTKKQACLESPAGLPAKPPAELTRGLVDEPARSAPSPLAVGHLDKSHIAIHTYPEYNHLSGIASFRVDVDIATCGMISPLSALHYLIESFEAEVVIMDYKVRGFTRDNRGRKLFIDHDISSIQDYITDDILRDYVAYDVNIISDNNFHTKMRKREIRLSEFLFGGDVTNLVPAERKRIKKALELEVQEIFECKALNARGG